MIKLTMRIMALCTVFFGLLGLALEQWEGWTPRAVTPNDLWFLTGLIMMTILAKGK